VADDDVERDALLAEAVRQRQQGQAEEARALLLELSQRYPGDAEVAYQTAWAHDTLGLEAEAVPFYERSLAVGELSATDRAGAFLGLGSTYRALGRYTESTATLRRGCAEFPDDRALDVFLAMTLYNLGEARESCSLLLKLLAATSADEQVRRYRRAIEFYADDLDATF
jgi:tetratricopeptide (TPR) repeat protein